eukprot:TRINITY_DN2385_c0_g1_i1.p1 TRINITY_DN2385_c0_g1~~TRINITY_DN2385_c0_g1_i1.p1  ORF type:complete len:466 (+),score=104.23 TRINITY_DN2385_c0_g1_i1:74-1471(+)
MLRVRVEEREGKGKVLVAVQDLEAGDVIFEEDPLITCHVGQSPIKSVETVFDSLKVDSAFFYSALQIATSSEELVKDVLSLFCPSESDFNINPTAKKRYSLLLSAIQKLPPEAFPTTIPKEQFMSLLLIVDLNGVDTSSESNRACSIYKTFSRMSHDCWPNAWHWKTNTQNKQIVRALRKIAQGEEITISYLDADDLLKSGSYRNGLLSVQKLFVCCCSRCREDRTRNFVCVRCKVGRAGYGRNGGAESVKCEEGKCKYVFNKRDKQIVMEKEEELVAYVSSVPGLIEKMRVSSGNPHEAVGALGTAKERALKTVHRCHWVVDQLNRYLFELYKYVLQDHNKAVEICKERIEFMEVAYPGEFFLKAVRKEEAGDCLMDAGVELCGEAKGFYESALKSFQFIYGDEHPFTVKVTKKLQSCETSLKQCANPKCSKNLDKFCAKCKKIGYCSRECQVSDWPRHKLLCK